MKEFNMRVILALMAMSVNIVNTQALPSSSRKGFKLHTGKVWSDDQCDLIQFYASSNPDDCIQECSYYPTCTAFNYIGTGCVLRDCPLPVPEPENNQVKHFNGYSLDEDNSVDQSETIPVSKNKQNPVSQSILQTTSAPIIHVVEVDSTNKPISVVPTSQSTPVAPVNQAIPVAPIIQPITLSPINQPIPVTPIIQPIAAYPDNRTSEVVEDRTPINQPIPVTPIIQPIAAYPDNRTSEVVEDRTTREFQYFAEKADQSKVNNNLVEALHTAAKANLSEVVNALLNAGIDKNARNDKGMTPLYVASWFGSLSVVQKLIEHDANVDIQANNGSTPLMVATWKGNINIVKALLDANANTELFNLNGETAIHNTAAYNRPNIARLLLQKGVDTMKQDKWGFTPEELAIEQGSSRVADIIRDFSSKSSTNQQSTSSIHSISVDISSSHSSTSASVSETTIVIPSNQSSTVIEKEEHTPLLDIPSSHSSTNASVSETTMVTPSNQSSAVIDSGENELWYAAERGDINFVNNSIESGTNLNWKNPSQNHSTALHAAANANYTEIVSTLLEAGAEKDIVNDQGMTPLYLATWSGNTDVVNKLIEYDVDIDIQANNGSTPLMVATWEGNLDIVETLLEANANTSLMNLHNETALHNAAGYNRPNIARLLLQDGVDTSKKDKWGLTPEELAKEQGYHEVESIIKNFTSISYRTTNDTSEEI